MMEDAIAVCKVKIIFKAQNMNYERIQNNWYIVGLNCAHYRKIDLQNNSMHMNIYEWVFNAI